jgi:2-C-methyl-D-erythritol 2,4-cyclodiphosphate synthase
MSGRVGLGFDVHPFGGDRPLVLGGVTLEGPGLVGHSDGDAVAHAVADAVLGAAGLPDIGTLFPATDEQYAGASSLWMLGEIAARVARERWWVENVDVVIAAEQPKLAPHVQTMADNVRTALDVAREPLGLGVGVSVKPKRGEGLGFVGRVEGIAVWAVALLERG